MVVDKGVANRFIKHAIAQVKIGRPPGQDEAPAKTNDSRVPVKVTSKMIARAQYEKELKGMGSEEEDDLEVIDDVSSDVEQKSSSSAKGKGKQLATSDTPVDSRSTTGQKRRRPAVDPFAGTEVISMHFSLLKRILH